MNCAEVRRAEWGFRVEGDLPAATCVGETDGESDGWDDDQGAVLLWILGWLGA